MNEAPLPFLYSEVLAKRRCRGKHRLNSPLKKVEKSLKQGLIDEEVELGFERGPHLNEIIPGVNSDQLSKK